MFQENRILALIAARAGSKGLPGKNIKELAGKPLIQWTIEAARKSQFIDEVVVSTDGQEIADVAVQTQAKVPFLRPADLADDQAGIEDVIDHALAWLKDNEEQTFDIVMLLMPTSPFRDHNHIDESIEAYFSKRLSPADSMVSVTKAPQKSGFLMRENDQGYINFCLQKLSGKRGLRRQLLPTFYMPNGAIYIANTEYFDRGFYHERTQLFEMNEQDSFDIDTLEDLEKAESMLAGRQKYR